MARNAHTSKAATYNVLRLTAGSSDIVAQVIGPLGYSSLALPIRMALRPKCTTYPPTARYITGLLMAMGALKSKSMMALLLTSSVNET